MRSETEFPALLSMERSFGRRAGRVMKKVLRFSEYCVPEVASGVSRVFEIGPFQLDAEAGVLARDGTPMALGTRAIGVLTTLVEHANDYVSKQRIIDAAWPGIVVEESNLTVQIAAIRRVLAEAGGKQWIETLARRGYRFVGPVRALHNGHEPESAAEHENGRNASNLPASLTSFIGRERELVEIKRLLPAKRLLTIVGAGGIGKTRLALQVAQEVVDAYRDGVWLAELGSIRDPALVAAAVAQTLRVQERTGTPVDESLCAFLKPREILLILDNCEHLLEACARLAELLLRGANNITFIATSREPLGITGEQTYPLHPLSLPEQGSTVEAMVRSEAVQLFVERVQCQLPDFQLSAGRADAVAGICIHLDGIPLALELAAARARSLSVAEITARLGDRFGLLTGGSRNALPRQQTLRATLDWSHDLLSAPEQVMLRRLAVFTGSFAADAAAAVAGDADIAGHEPIDLLAQLVARSLVIADTSAGTTRYRLLETTRSYALEKLAASGDTALCRRHHATHFRRAFERAPDDWLRMRVPDWLAKYRAELDNVRVALDWAFGDDGDSSIGIALAGASGMLWLTVGLFGEGAQRLETAIARIETATPEPEQAQLWVSLARLMEHTPTRSQPAVDEAIKLYRRLGDAVGLGMSLVRLARTLTLMGRFDQAETSLREARPLLENAGVPRAFGLLLFNSAYLKSFTGDLHGARQDYERALAIDLEWGDEYAALATMGNLGNVSWALGDLDAAAIAMRRQVALLRQSAASTRPLQAFALMNLAGLMAERGELDEALTLAREGLPMAREDGWAWLFFDEIALRIARSGKLGDAALLAGYADALHAANAATRQLVTMRVRERLHTILRAGLDSDELQRLLADGTKLGESEACALALRD